MDNIDENSHGVFEEVIEYFTNRIFTVMNSESQVDFTSLYKKTRGVVRHIIINVALTFFTHIRLNFFAYLNDWLCLFFLNIQWFAIKKIQFPKKNEKYYITRQKLFENTNNCMSN